MSTPIAASDQKLFTPGRIGAIEVRNRVAMAPLTRSRASADGVPSPLAVEYYRQRASAGLIVAEATNISRQGRGYAWTPGIYTPEQVEAWKRVTDAVHAAGGKIVLQLWHVGRMSHVSLQKDGAAPVAPSALQAGTVVFTEAGFEPPSAPRALALSELPGLVEDYRRAAVNAKLAGFDGVEIHAANGYLLEQFLRDSTNRRTDPYGGSIENRARFVLEVVDAVTECGARTASACACRRCRRRSAIRRSTARRPRPTATWPVSSASADWPISTSWRVSCMPATAPMPSTWKRCDTPSAAPTSPTTATTASAR